MVARGSARRSRPRRVPVVLLVVAAVVVAAVLMGALTAQAVRANKSCASHPVILHLAVTQDLAPAIEPVARNFNRQERPAQGHCVKVEVTAAGSATVAGQIDGQATGAAAATTAVTTGHGAADPGAAPRARRAAPVDAWIPDSSLWVDVARIYALGAGAVQPTGLDVARSPLMIVMPPAVARKTGLFSSPEGWNILLPPSDGGPPASMGLHVDLPDPASSSAGLATLVELSRLLGTGAAARTGFTQFALRSEVTSQFDDPAALASFVATTGPPFNARPVTVTTEQAVIAYDRLHRAHPLAAQYPTGFRRDLGTPELNYPFVLTTRRRAEVQAARDFEQALRQPYAAGLIRYQGFRAASGTGDKVPASYGISAQVLQRAAPAGGSQAQTTLEAWGKLGLGSRDLVLIDTSAAMASPVPATGLTLEQVLTQTAVAGLALFPDSTQMGEWQINSRVSHGLPYQPLVSVGPLTGDIGLITRRQELQHTDQVLRPVQRGLALNDAILAAYKSMLASYKPRYSNAVIVLTAGVDDANADMSASALVARLHALYDPQRRVEIVILMMGGAGDFRALQRIADVTGGGAYDITSPGQVGKVFFEAFSHRLCAPGAGCAAP
jgi:Ca-activated chloride channel homolog